MKERLLRVKQYSISHEFFEQGYPRGQSPCTCTSKCCNGGVWADVNERDAILANKDLIKQFMDESQTTDDAQWFESGIRDDKDFPSGTAVGTQVYNEKCAFLDEFGRCSIQVASVESGMHKWAMKPLFCVLFPAEISDGVIGFDPMHQDEEPCCSITSDFETPLYQACKEELTHLLGEDGFKVLDEHFASLQASAYATEAATAHS